MLTLDPDLQAKLDTDPLVQQAFLQEKGKADFRYFCRTLLGYTDMNAEHDALCEFLQYTPARIKLMLMPRYTFKSSIITIGHSLWLLAKNPNEKLLLYSDATEKAEGFLLGVKNHILGLVQSSHFRDVYGPWETDSKVSVWNQSAVVIRPRTEAAVEPSVDTAGLETSKVGKHYSRIKFDDLVCDKNVTTKDLMDKVEGIYKKAGSLLQPSGQTDLAGTRWHFGDLYGRLMAEYKGDPAFAVFHRQAQVGTTYFFADIGKDALTPAFLASKLATQGSYLYSCLYQNEPVDEATAIFKHRDFAFYQPALRSQPSFRAQLYITCCLDPAISQHAGADDTAITVVGTDNELTMHLLDVVAGQLLPDAMVDAVFRLHQAWHFAVFGLETNAFQKMLRRDIERRFAQERKANPSFTCFQIQEFTGTSSNTKDLRIRALQPYHERGALKFPGDTVEHLTGDYAKLAFQMLEYPHSKHDDLLDSLAYHVPIHRAGQALTPKITAPPLSVAWAEAQRYERKTNDMAAQPRWLRQPVEPALV